MNQPVSLPDFRLTTGGRLHTDVKNTNRLCSTPVFSGELSNENAIRLIDRRRLFANLDVKPTNRMTRSFTFQSQKH